jgi:hypothetical protein
MRNGEEWIEKSGTNNWRGRRDPVAAGQGHLNGGSASDKRRRLRNSEMDK